MPQQIGQPLFQSFRIFLPQTALFRAAVMLKGPDRGHDHHGIGGETRLPALDVQELFRTQIRAKARLRHHIIPQLKCQPGGHDAVAAVGNIGKRPAVDEGGGMLQRLYQIGLDGVFQQGSHGSLSLELSRRHRIARPAVPHHNGGEPFFKIGQTVCQTQDGHDLRGHCDVKAVLPRHAVHPSSQAVHHLAQLAIVHVYTALPGNPPGVDVQGVALLNMVVQHGGQQIIGRPNGVHVAGEMKIDILHGDDLSPSAAGGAAFDPKNRAQRGFPQGQYRFFAQTAQRIAQPHRRGGLSLPCRGGGNGGDQNQLAVRPPRHTPYSGQGNLGLIFSIKLQIVAAEIQTGGDFFNWLGSYALRDLNIGHTISHAVSRLSFDW